MALADPPILDPIISIPKPKPGEPPNTLTGLLSYLWIQYFAALVARLGQSPQTLEPVTRTNQSTSIGATAINAAASAGPGRYRLTFYVRKTTIDGVTSSIGVTFGWTDGGIACTLPSAALALDATNAVASGTAIVEADNGAAITYATTYASNTPAKMKYKLTVEMEALP